MNFPRTLLLISSIVILAGAGCNQGTTSAIQTPEPVTNSQIELQGLESIPVVSIRPDGFYPRTVTIKKGEKVLWINEDIGNNHEPASNPHPTHTNYPEFDSKTPLAPGSSWEFTFNKVGTWGYHDHVSPTKTGTVIVE